MNDNPSLVSRQSSDPGETSSSSGGSIMRNNCTTTTEPVENAAAAAAAATTATDRRQLFERGWSMNQILEPFHNSSSYSLEPLPAKSHRATTTTGAFDLSHFHESWTTTSDGEDLFGPVSPVGPTRRLSTAGAVGVSGSIATSRVDSNGTPSAVHDAARITNWDAVLELCHSNPSWATYRSREGWTALHHACNRRCPHETVVEALLEAHPGALLQTEEKGWLPLHYACRFKAPTAVVRLLLHKYPNKGHKTVSQPDRLGRTPLYYAIRYDAPPGVVGLLLQIDPAVVLEEDQNEDSPLALVWDSWAEKLEGKRLVNSFLPGGFPEPEDRTVEERTKILRDRLQREPKLFKRWMKVNMLLKAAFGFPVEESKQDVTTPPSTPRKWRIVHATAAVKCHLSLFLLACALHPEQVHELDCGDLQRPGDIYVEGASQTALHLAASSNAGGEPGKTVLLTLLSQYREAAKFPDGVDGSLPLHRMVENPRKQDWSNHAAILYRFYPRAVQRADNHGRLPLHRATAALQRVPLQEDEESVIMQLVRVFPQAVLQTDQSGCLPMHNIAANASVWNNAVEAVYHVHRNAVLVRAGPAHHNRLPIHMAAANPKAQDSLIARFIQHHPRGVSMSDGEGRLPLHLACDIGKHWDEGVSSLYQAFPNAVQATEHHPRGWYPLHMAANAVNSDARLIQELLRLHPAAASIADSEGKYPLHLACQSGKTWLGGLEELFEVDPTPALKVDAHGWLPFHWAAWNVCKRHELDDEDDIEDIKTRVEKDAADAASIDVLFNLLRGDPTVVEYDG